MTREFSIFNFSGEKHRARQTHSRQMISDMLENVYLLFSLKGIFPTLNSRLINWNFASLFRTTPVFPSDAAAVCKYFRKRRKFNMNKFHELVSIPHTQSASASLCTPSHYVLKWSRFNQILNQHHYFDNISSKAPFFLPLSLPSADFPAFSLVEAIF